MSKEPSTGFWVSLSEALTWIAFRHALSDEELAAAIWGPPDEANPHRDALSGGERPDPPAHGLGQFADRDRGLQQLADALAMIVEGVNRGVVKLRARYSPGYSAKDEPQGYSIRKAYDAHPKDLAGNDLAAHGQFEVAKQFDLGTGTYLYASALLRRPPGQPTIMWPGHSKAEERDWLLATGADGYLLVEASRDGVMPLAFDQLSDAANPPAPEPWSEDRMKAEIAACSIGNREDAWTKCFKPRAREHGWKNTAFRDIWSEGRGSKGTTGRPIKHA